MQGDEHLRAQARKEPVQAMQGDGHLPAQPPKKPLLPMQGDEHLRAQARKEPVQAMQGENKERIEGHLRREDQRATLGQSK
jgi:hypothetical protein